MLRLELRSGLGAPGEGAGKQPMPSRSAERCQPGGPPGQDGQARSNRGAGVFPTVSPGEHEPVRTKPRGVRRLLKGTLTYLPVTISAHTL